MKSCTISGSFDPITNGHVWLVNEALTMFDRVQFVVATNPAKKHMFNQVERFELAVKVFEHMLDRVEIRLLPERMMLVDYAMEIDAPVIVRGLRNTTDFEYEHSIDMVQRLKQPTVRTMFLMTPRELTEVSSSMVRGLVGLRGWGLVVDDYVPPAVFTALVSKNAGK